MKKRLLTLLFALLVSVQAFAACPSFQPNTILSAASLNAAIGSPCIVSGTADSLSITNSIINTSAGSFTTLSSPLVSFTGGLIDNVAVGSVTPKTGSFTTLAASGTVSGTGFSAYLASPPAIGGTAPAAGSFTTLSASGGVHVTGGSQAPGYISATAITGLTMGAVTGAVLDYQVTNAASTIAIMGVPTGQSYVNFGAGLNSPAIGAQAPGTVAATALLFNSKTAVSSTAPTIASGFGTSPSIVSSNGTATFTINVGTGGTANSGVVTMPAATTGWNCTVTPAAAPQAAGVTYSVATSTTSITISNYNQSNGALAAWLASAIIAVNCVGF